MRNLRPFVRHDCWKRGQTTTYWASQCTDLVRHQMQMANQSGSPMSSLSLRRHSACLNRDVKNESETRIVNSTHFTFKLNQLKQWHYSMRTFRTQMFTQPFRRSIASYTAYSLFICLWCIFPSISWYRNIAQTRSIYFGIFNSFRNAINRAGECRSLRDDKIIKESTTRVPRTPNEILYAKYFFFHRQIMTRIQFHFSRFFHF